VSVETPSLTDAAVLDALSSQRLAALLDKYRNGRATKADLAELRIRLGGRLPHEPARPAEPPATAPVAPARPADTGPPIPREVPFLPFSASGAADLDLFRDARERHAAQALQGTPEYQLIIAAAGSAFHERPTVPPWQWADDPTEGVYLDEKMTSEPGQYDSSKTPWTREIQALPLDPNCRVGVFKKSSRSGGSEAAFNVARWMPRHWPGNVGIVFPDDKQARDVADRRLVDSIKKSAEAVLTDDPDDVTLSNITLANMVVRLGGSGSPRMFTEIWFRLGILDEYEEHSQRDTTTTLSRMLSRQADVADALTLVISKPKRAGGPIDLAYIAGTQKKYLVPCPHCSGLIEFKREYFQYNHCRNPDGTWDLNRVINETFYQCQLCEKPIYERSKVAMCQAGKWVPTPAAQRRKAPDGQYVPPQPGWESYQISDYYSFHAPLAWGQLMTMYLMAFEIQPKLEDQTHYINNHEGEADEPQLIAVDILTIAALVAGRVEEREITAPDGTKVIQTQTLGLPGGFNLAYRDGVPQAPLPFVPLTLLLFIDKQESCLKYLVYAVTPEGDAFVIDLGRVDDEDQLYDTVLQRQYRFAGLTEHLEIASGYMDARYRPQEAYAFCLRAIALGKRIYPVRGEGDNEKYKGKTIRKMEDRCEKGRIVVRYFKDAPVKNEFYQNKIQKRAGWRIWLPVDYPDGLAREWTAERWDEANEVWVHDKVKHGPNDWGDCGKYIILWMIENREKLLAKRAAPPPVEVEAIEVEQDAAIPPVQRPAREYLLRPPGE